MSAETTETGVTFPVEAGHVLTFARAIGDPNPVYADADRARGEGFADVIAPPTFLAAAVRYDEDWALRPKPGQPWLGSGATPTGLATVDRESTNVLHAEQHFTYHRNVVVGDRLSLEIRPGATWEKQGRRGGVLQFAEQILEFRDPQGELVVTARGVSVVTAQAVDSD